MPNRGLKFFWWLVLVFAIVLLFIVWLYSGRVSAARLSVFRHVSLPIALVNDQLIWSNTLSERLKLMQSMQAQQGKAGDSAAVFNQLLKEAVINQLAAVHNLTVSRQDMDQALRNYQQDPSFAPALKSYGLTITSFENEALKPQLLSTKLQIWYNANKDLNNSAYWKIQALQAKLSAGQDFGQLARNYSEDSQNQLQGDLGEVPRRQLLPELADSLSGAKIGETKVVPIRLGLYLIKIENLQTDSVHLREIFINTGDFNQWLTQQIQNFNIKKLITI